MKKSIILIFLLVVSTTMFSQGLLHKVTSSIFLIDQKALPVGKMLLVLPNGTSILSGSWQVRLDATICPQTAYNWDATLKRFVPTSLNAIGPGIGFKHYIPTSTTDLTPFENYGFSAAVMFGANIYQPDLSKIMFAQEADLLQYIKFGVTETLNTKNWFGFFIGSGITF
jgi:hypothetical protein